MIEPRMVDKPAFTVVGVMAVGHPETLNYSEIWEKQYMPIDKQLKPYSIDGGYYGVTLSEGGQIVYLAGMAVKGLPELPPSAEQRVVGRAHYAVFDCVISTIGATWHEAYEQWLPESEYALDDSRVDFEYYPPYSGQGEMKVEIYIPVRVKELA